MKQTVELDPELVAYRATASFYAQDAFRHGVFPEILNHDGREHLAWLEHSFQSGKPLHDGEIPSADRMAGVYQIDALRSFPRVLIDASPEALVNILQNAGILDEDKLEIGMAIYTPVFGTTPTNSERYFISRAMQEISPQILDTHPSAPLDGMPELFSEGLPFIQQSPFKRFISRARAQRLSHMKEYIEGVSKETGALTIIQNFFPPRAHEEVILWSDNERLLAHFFNAHGPVDGADTLENMQVRLKHLNDIHERTYKLKNGNVDQVSRQILQFVIDLTKIKDPKRY